MTRVVFIYTLKDPITEEIRYVGKTVTALNTRLKVHIHQSKKKKKLTYKEAWIKGLLNINLKPIIELVEKCNTENWVEREKYWICFYKSKSKITNLTEGGDGSHGHQPSDETRELVRGKMLGNKHGAGKKWTKEAIEKRNSNPNYINRKIRRGFAVAQETKIKMSAAHTGHARGGWKWSAEKKEKFKEAHQKSWETRRNNLQKKTI